MKGSPSRSHIIIVGPVGIGKTSVADRLGPRLGLPVVTLDQEAAEEGDDGQAWEDEARAIAAGEDAWAEYSRTRALELISRLMQQHDGAVFDCGGSDLIFNDDASREQALALLRPARLIAIVPAPHEHPLPDQTGAPNFWRSPAFALIADKTVVRNHRKPEVLLEEIVRWLEGSDRVAGAPDNEG